MPALPHVASGKVREIYEVDADHLLFVATDRISAYDVILPTAIPDKGRVLTGVSLFFFDLLDTPHHVVTTDLAGLGLSVSEAADLRGRAMVVARADVLPIECVVRGYLYGSAWREYESGGGPTTEGLPPGLRQADRLPAPVFTPATKAASGHDENLSESQARSLVGDTVYTEVRNRSIALYERATAHAAERGVLLADTKFEFGFVHGELTLVDEVLTPDSSRWWPAAEWSPGGPVPSFDKQYVRDWLDSSGWDHHPPAPALPDAVVSGTRSRYIEAYEAITGNGFDAYLEAAT
ncbi:MAG: phosphoribosylaminoimidazolesuccinocarboxamide synthase [Acidimicrobiia bacterium]